MGIQAVTLPRDAVVDGETIELNGSGELQTKNGGLQNVQHTGAEITAVINNRHVIISGDPDHAVSQAHGLTLSSGGSTASDAGFKITIGARDCELISVTKHASATATKAYLKDAAGVEIANAAFSGNVATFATPQALSANTVYRVECDNDGSNYTVYSGTGTPVASSLLTWTTGSVNGADNASCHNVVSVSIGEQTVEVTLPSTAEQGETFEILNPYSTYLNFTQGASQQIIGVDGTASTAGASGGATTNSTFVKLVCVVANTTFLVVHTNDTITLT